MKASGIITLLTDFGTADAFVGIMKGVILGIHPEARLVDLTHGIPPQQVLLAALALRSAVPFFPPGTVHVAVVDPGVGSGREAIVIETEQGALVGPDNGILGLAAERMHAAGVYRISNEALICQPVSNTFHGRDVFAPVAAHLARGLAPERCGPRLDAVATLALPQVQHDGNVVSGVVIYVDHFGNAVSNITAETLARFPASAVSVSINGARVVGPVNAYAAVPEGAALATVGSWGLLEIAVRNGNAARVFAAGPGTPVTVVVESSDV